LLFSHIFLVKTFPFLISNLCSLIQVILIEGIFFSIHDSFFQFKTFPKIILILTFLEGLSLTIFSRLMMEFIKLSQVG